MDLTQFLSPRVLDLRWRHTEVMAAYGDYVVVGYSKPETQMAAADVSDYDVDGQQRFLCDGTGDGSSCDFG